jgi:hypothetical protein
LALDPGASRPDQLIAHPETHLVAVKTVGDRNVLNITVPELAMHFKKWAATDHLLGPLQLQRGFILLADDVHAQFNALVADKYGRTGDELAHLVLALAAERAMEAVSWFRRR